MKLKTLLRFLRSWPQARLLLGVTRDARGLHRIAFVATAYEEGVYRAIGDGAATLETIAESLGIADNYDGLRAWLDLGVSLGELSCGDKGYRVAGGLSKRLLSPANDAVLALFQEMASLQHTYIRRTPELLREGRRLPFATLDGIMIARASRTLEPFVSEAVERTVPREGAVRLLEVGCGSGIHIRQACQLNPALSTLGLELDPDVAEMARRNGDEWGLSHRVRIETISILDFESDEPFDLITLHNNIYYFPVDGRVEVLRRLFRMLKAGGQLLITTGCQGGDPLMHVLDIECAMTEGMGRLPRVDELLHQLEAAGFVARSQQLVPFTAYYAFTGVRQ